MVTFKNIRVKMKGGRSRIQRAMVLTSGKLRFVKNLSRSRRSSRAKTKTKTRSVIKTGKKKRGGYRGLNIERAVFKLAKPIALVAPGIAAYERTHRLDWTLTDYVGYNQSDRRFDWNLFANMWFPFAAVNIAEVGYRAGKRLLRSLFR